MINRNPLLDEVFLQQLYSNRQKEIYAKIIALDKDENAVEQIEGQVTGGSVSLDGTSNVRRSCSLTMITDNIDINAYYWGFKNKFRLFIGLGNYIDPQYDDIIWFPMGTMIITSFSTSLSASSYTISISGKDKMCLLNGDVSGSLFASIDFGKQEIYNRETKITTIEDIPIKTIVREAVHEYAGERWENIIINDLDDLGLELLDYKGSSPLYLLISETSGSNEYLGNVFQIMIDPSFKIYPLGSSTPITINNVERYNERTILNFENAPVAEYDLFTFGPTASRNTIFSVAKIEYGQTCGYRYTDITYAGDLILNVGEPITAMLDKLVAMLGNWEYFYDVDGRFVFQRKKTYLDKTWNTIITNNDNSYLPNMGETYIESALWSSAVSWNFTDGFFVTNFNNNPALNNVRNDYSIWGTRQSISGAELPVHLRYAIDKKPTYYKTIEYIDDNGDPQGGIEWTTENGAWWVKDGKEYTAQEKEEEVITTAIYNEVQNRTYDIGTITLKHRAEVASWPWAVPYQNPQTGLWTKGWWDIEDWRDYYYTVKHEYPDSQSISAYTLKADSYTVNNEPFSYTQLFGDKPFMVANGNTTLRRLIDIYQLRNIYTGEISYWVENMHDGSTGCGHNYGEFYENVIACNQAAANGTPRAAQGLWGRQNAFLENKEVVQAHTYFYSPDISQESYQDLQELIEQEVTRDIITIYTPEKVVSDLIEAGYEYVERNANCDWREIIFQMALDYRKHMHDDDFLLKVRETNGKKLDGEWYYPSGKTGYEQYYTDLEGFWRQLYCPPQLLAEWKDTHVWTDRATHVMSVINTSDTDITITLNNAAKTNITYFLSTSWVENGYADKSGWNKQIIESPSTINFWFDFLDADNDSDFARYSVPIIGDRAKSVNDNNVKAIYFREIPNTIFTDDVSTIERKSGYTYMQYQESMAPLFNISTQGKCAIDVLEEWINNYVYAIEASNITTVPIYHLEPNTRIKIMDANSKINGDYIVSRISIPLTYNGTMSITATKVADRIY